MCVEEKSRRGWIRYGTASDSGLDGGTGLAPVGGSSRGWERVKRKSANGQGCAQSAVVGLPRVADDGEKEPALQGPSGGVEDENTSFEKRAKEWRAPLRERLVSREGAVVMSETKTGTRGWEGECQVAGRERPSPGVPSSAS